MTIPFVVLATLVITSVGLITLFRFWLDRVYTEDTTFVRVSSRYRVAVPGTPTISSRLYSLSYTQKYLLVLTSEASRLPEPYYIDLLGEEIGVPSLGQYQDIPLFGGALVDRECERGIVPDEVIVADWEVKDHWREVHIRIKGIKPQGVESPAEQERCSRQVIPLGYEREVILTSSHEMYAGEPTKEIGGHQGGN